MKSFSIVDFVLFFWYIFLPLFLYLLSKLSFKIFKKDIWIIKMVRKFTYFLMKFITVNWFVPHTDLAESIEEDMEKNIDKWS